MPKKCHAIGKGIAIYEGKVSRQRKPKTSEKGKNMKNAPNRVLADFGKREGVFEGDPEAWEISRKMSKNQKRKLRRYGIIPSCFFQYLARTNVIREYDVPKEPKTIGWLLNRLRFYRYTNEAARSMGEFLYREIIKGEIPWLAKSFWQGDYVWEKLEESQSKIREFEKRIESHIYRA